MIENSKAKLKNKSISNKKSTKVLELKAERNEGNPTESNISIITKSTNPKVVIQSENVNDRFLNRDNTHQLLKSVCLIVMCIILLITFFLSLKTYNNVNELSDYIHQIIQL